MSAPEKRQKLGELLVDAGILSKAQLAAALSEQRSWGNRLGVTLVRMGVIGEEDLVRALALQLSLPVVRLRGKRAESEALELVSPEFADKHRCLPLFLRSEGNARVLSLAMEDPLDLETVDTLRFRLGLKIRPVLIPLSELDDALHRHYHWDSVGVAGSAPEDVGEVESPELEVVEEVRRPPEPTEPLASGSVPGDSGVSGVPGVGSEAILRALTQLLVEKGVFTREELVARVSSLAAKGPGAD